MRNKIPVCLSLDEDLVKLVDRERGVAGRSAFIEDIVREKLIK